MSVPARPEYVHVLRSVIASVAARQNFPYDGIDDLRIAVDEACAHLLTMREGAGLLHLRIRPQEGSIEVVAAIEADGRDWPPAGADQTLTWQVLSGLVDTADFERDEVGPGIRFLKRLTSA